MGKLAFYLGLEGERWELREEAPCRQEEPRKGTKAGVNLSCASVGER